jgi:hypothetical protein
VTPHRTLLSIRNSHSFSFLFSQTPETITASNWIMSRLRKQSTYRKKNSKKAPATLSKAINKVGLPESSIRVNRVGGPIGHAGGMTMSGLRRATISPYVPDAIPCNWSSGPSDRRHTRGTQQPFLP